MALREKLTERVQPLLEPGEQIQRVFPAQAGPMWAMLFGAVGAMFLKPRVVAVTDRRIVVFSAGKMTGTNPQEKLAEVPRQTKLAPRGGTLMKVTIGGETLTIHRRFKKDIEAADAAG